MVTVIAECASKGFRPESPDESTFTPPAPRIRHSHSQLLTLHQFIFYCISRSLRDWVVNVKKATQAQLAKDAHEQGISFKSPSKTLETVRNQFSSAQTRLMPFSGSANTGSLLINYPVAKLTYPECLEELDDLSQVI